ncbi:hypothetical protein H5397_14005 [Propioniciclava sp. MC1683]|uniref:hypothetical protein n=1 Tax=Propioniciclava sp. MC1683 TaxID=2760309 RepID=UPI0016029D9F|nr:hypothetical protein [Propioniciclava sp. MC1683]MBB1502528.1 hypothetical protein [Propioniciclava sp. MC1683]
MREQDLRDLLSRYTPSGEGAPAASSIRGRATRRRLVPVGVAAVAVVAAGALLVPQVLTQPAVPAPAASPTVPATPASGTPMPTPSATPSPVVTPTLSCPEIRDAWREALTTPLELPLGLGSNPRLLNVRGDAVIVGGQVNGRLVQRVFPHGLAGDSYALPPVTEGAMLLLAELTEERIVYGELWDSATPRRWRFHVQHGPDAEPRLLVDSRDSDGVAGLYPFWVEGTPCAGSRS